MKMEILLEPTSNKLMVDPHGFEGYLKVEVKLKNFKKDATLKLFKSTNQERYEHLGPEVTSLQDSKGHEMAKRDYAWLMISRCSRSHSRQAEEQAQDLKSMITTSNHKLMIEVKRAQD
ncbi:hypothetical protein Tco_0895269 [Tanacetum coccineum]|uniref:Uncharacterized protein n=1 Tax=Tanacetum coccineum TaxID=301880 RepID=A0ABQ5CGF1_9ASTR